MYALALRFHHTTGSHYVLKRESGFRVTIAYYNKNLKRGTLASIIRQAGLTVEEFTKLRKDGFRVPERHFPALYYRARQEPPA